MWTAENRGNYERAAARYPSDVTDEEWALIEPHLGPERETCRRELLNAILYVLTTGCQWRQLPKDLPPKKPKTLVFMQSFGSNLLCSIFFNIFIYPQRVRRV